jgi:hypothetical protein
MLIVAIACLTLIALTALVHDEVLGALNTWLAGLRIARRSKLLVVFFASVAAHAFEVLLYGFALYGLVRWAGVGGLAGSAGFSLQTCLYFSAETDTSLGFGDLTPVGPIRLLAGAEALNGLLLIGWTASYTHIAMERFGTQTDLRM